MELSRGYMGVTWQTIKDCRAKKLYRGVLRQEQARLRAVTPATPLPATPRPSSHLSTPPIPVQPNQHVPTTKPCITSRMPRLNTKRKSPGEVHAPTGPIDRLWSADDTRALALLELQAPTAMLGDEELAALLPKRTWESVREHRR
ncbi:unnamed protein product, partial [Ixodes persulcatus]